MMKLRIALAAAFMVLTTSCATAPSIPFETPNLSQDVACGLEIALAVGTGDVLPAVRTCGPVLVRGGKDAVAVIHAIGAIIAKKRDERQHATPVAPCATPTPVPAQKPIVPQPPTPAPLPAPKPDDSMRRLKDLMDEVFR